MHSGKWSGESLFSAKALNFPSDEVQGKSLEQSLQLMALRGGWETLLGFFSFAKVPWNWTTRRRVAINTLVINRSHCHFRSLTLHCYFGFRWNELIPMEIIIIGYKLVAPSLNPCRPQSLINSIAVLFTDRGCQVSGASLEIKWNPINLLGNPFPTCNTREDLTLFWQKLPLFHLFETQI